MLTDIAVLGLILDVSKKFIDVAEIINAVIVLILLLFEFISNNYSLKKRFLKKARQFQ